MYLYTFLIGLAMYLCEVFASLHTEKFKTFFKKKILYSNDWPFGLGQIIVFAKQAQKK